MTEHVKKFLYNVDHGRSVMEAAKLIKEYCANKECEDCIFYGQRECRISFESPFGGTVPPEDWEV